METAAVYALAAYRGVTTCSVLVITDGVWDDWRPAFDTPAVRRAFDIVSRTLPTAVTAAS
jgi:purine-nucleoside phosphorylase